VAEDFRGEEGRLTGGATGRLSLWAPVVVVAAAILYLSVIRRPLGWAELPLQSDKLGHLAAYGVLSFLLARALGARHSGASVAVSAAAWATAYGGLLEVVQPMVGRTADFLDLAASLLGAALAAALWVRLRRGG